MKSKITLAIFIIIILITVILINMIKKDEWDENEASMKLKVLSTEDSVETLNLLDVTPFDWDEVYSFDPYTPKETIYEVIGYKWGKINETVNEGMNQIVFLNDGKVVCYLYGYPENNEYGIYFTNTNNTEITFASMLTFEEDLTFQVERENGVIYLTNIE